MSEEAAKAAPEPKPLPAWGDKLMALDKAWASLETKLAVAIIVLEMLSLCAWVFLKGISSPPNVNAAGLVLRAAVTAAALGSLVWFLLRKQPDGLRKGATTAAVIAGLLLGRAWVNVGVGYAAELVGWYQDASLLAMVGGLRAVGTRCTIWLAMLGASLATSSGKHINVDVIMRFLSPRARVPAGVAAWVAAGVVCLATSWGFTEHIAVTSFGAKANDTASAKIGHILHESGDHWFAFRRQAEVDAKVGWRVFSGKRYTKALTAAEWDTLVREGGWDKRYTPEQVKALYAPKGAEYVSPLVMLPGDKSSRGLLVEDLNLLFPFGFFVIGLKFLLRALMVISGHVEVDPDAAHREEGHEPEKEPAATTDTPSEPPDTLASPATPAEGKEGA